MTLQRTKANPIVLALTVTTIIFWAFPVQAFSVRIIAQPLSPTRVVKNVIGGLIRPFRTSKTLTDPTTEEGSQLYSLGLKPVIPLLESSTHQQFQHGHQRGFSVASSSRATSSQLGSASASAAAHTFSEIQQLYDIPSSLVERVNIVKKRVHQWNLQKVIAPSHRQMKPLTNRLETVAHDIQVHESATATATSTATATATDSLIGNLVQSFAICMDTENDDIKLDYLLDACKKFKDAMIAFGQKAMSENMAQNIEIVEEIFASAPTQHRNTLQSMLQYEKACGVKSPNGKLRKKSAALSLLWIRRAISFQHQFNINIVEQPELPSLEAALTAYAETVEPYHSWGLKNIFKVALRTTTPPRPRTLAQLHGSPDNDLDEKEMAQVIEQIKALRNTWQPLLCQWKLIFESLDLEDESKA